jgi:hypothetical protein
VRQVAVAFGCLGTVLAAADRVASRICGPDMRASMYKIGEQDGRNVQDLKVRMFYRMPARDNGFEGLRNFIIPGCTFSPLACH